MSVALLKNNEELRICPSLAKAMLRFPQCFQNMNKFEVSFTLDIVLFDKMFLLGLGIKLAYHDNLLVQDLQDNTK